MRSSWNYRTCAGCIGAVSRDSPVIGDTRRHATSALRDQKRHKTVTTPLDNTPARLWPRRRRVAVLRVMLDLLAFGEKDGVLADVGGEVGHTLEVAADEKELERRRDRARVLHHVRHEDAEDR